MKFTRIVLLVTVLTIVLIGAIFLVLPLFRQLEQNSRAAVNVIRSDTVVTVDSAKSKESLYVSPPRNPYLPAEED